MTQEEDNQRQEHILTQKVATITQKSGLMVSDTDTLLARLRPIVPYPEFCSDTFIAARLNEVVQTSPELFSVAAPSAGDEFNEWAGPRRLALMQTMTPQQKIALGNQFKEFQANKGKLTPRDLEIRHLESRENLNARERLKLAELRGESFRSKAVGAEVIQRDLDYLIGKFKRTHGEVRAGVAQQIAALKAKFGERAETE